MRSVGAAAQSRDRELSFHKTRALWASAVPLLVCAPSGLHQALAEPQGSCGTLLPFGKAEEWLWRQTELLWFLLWGRLVCKQNRPCAWILGTLSCLPKGRGVCETLSWESCQYSRGLCK